MKNSQNLAWIVGALFISVIIAIVVYFFAISPQLDATAEAHDETAAAKEFNDQLDIQILGMKKKAAEVPLWRGEMAAIAVDLPPTPDLSELNRFLITTLEASKNPVVSIEYGSPTLVEPGSESPTSPSDDLAPTPEPSAEPTAEPTDGASEEPTEPAEPAQPPASGDSGAANFQGLVAIPVTITTEGGPAGVMKTINAIANTQSRFLTISNLAIEKADITEAVPGRPALTEKDWETTITFMAFVLYQDGVTLAPEEPGVNPPFSSGGFTNPFVPLPGTEQESD